MLTIRRCLNACIQKATKESLHDDDDEDEETEKESISVRKSTLW